MGVINDLANDKSLSEFSIDNLLDALYILKVSSLDSTEWRVKQETARAKVIAELETRPVKDLVQSLIREALR